MKYMQWTFQHHAIPQSIDEVQQLLLAQLDVRDTAEFLNPTHPDTIDAAAVGLDVDAVDQAVSRIRQAYKEDDSIVIFGDYDVDGMTGTSLLWQTLHGLGMSVLPFIPDREKHGYGLSIAAIDDLFTKQKPDLIITVDNGIVAHEAVTHAQDAGVDVIVTDHHQQSTDKNPAKAVVHTTQLCGATVAWMLAREVARDFESDMLRLTGSDNLDLCVIATIADQVPLIGANRSFAAHGMRALRETERPGLKALFEVSGYEQATADATTIGFGLGPRLNAVGRLGKAIEAVRLLCTGSNQRAKKIAAQLDKMNQERRSLTKEATSRAYMLIDDPKVPLLFIEDEAAHPGIIGLVAGRITEKYHRPSVVMALDKESGLVKGSARSVAGVDVTALLRAAEDHMLSVGGHEMAAGFSAEVTSLVQIRQAVAKAAQDIDAALLEPKLHLAMRLPPGLVHEELVDMLDNFGPYGQANPRPTFALQEIEVLEAKRVGGDKSHLKLTLQTSGDASSLSAIGWRMGDQIQSATPGSTIDVAGRLEFNYWRGKRSVQMVLRDMRSVTR